MSEVVFEVPFASHTSINLQDAFFKYRQKKQNALHAKSKMEELAKIRRAQPEVMAALRKKFFEAAMSYVGVPYAKRFHQPDSPTYDSKKFLDCCGLVRQVLRDLKSEFGFNVGPWNQAYLFDTLPLELSTPEEMQQGDLVFVSGTYFSKKTKPQKHNMVHVEIWAGDGAKTLGARWQRGVIQMHDSYKFVSKTYGNMKYHFKSIDTWLMGLCRSHCSEHSWSISKYDPARHSIFALQDEVAEQQQQGSLYDQDQGSLDDHELESLDDQELRSLDDQELKSLDGQELRSLDDHELRSLDDHELRSLDDHELRSLDDRQLRSLDDHELRSLDDHELRSLDQELGSLQEFQEQAAMNGPVEPEQTLMNGSISLGQVTANCCCLSQYTNGVPGMTYFPSNTKPKTPAPPPRQGANKASSTVPGRRPFGASGPGQGRGGDRKVDHTKHGSVAKPSEGPRARTFLLCGKNAAPIVDQHLTKKGWRKLEGSRSLSFTLQWVECKQHIDFRSFREGQQMVNHFPNINLLTTKVGLLESLREYDKKPPATEQSVINIHEFTPVTYRLDVPTEKEEFLRTFTEGDIWICKPTGLNQGKGIFLVRDPKELTAKVDSSHSVQRIIQKYIMSPLLIDGRKFDIRVYMLIIAGSPFLVFYHTGYVRLSLVPYDLASTEMCVHLTNQYQQKKHPLYKEVKEDTVWSFEKLQSYLTEHHQLADDWVMNILTKRMQQIMQVCFKSVSDKLTHKIGFFDLLGFDFMLDSSFNVWLIEVNINPAMHTNCDTLKNMIPHIVEETLDLAIEVFDKCSSSQPVLPLTSLHEFILLDS